MEQTQKPKTAEEIERDSLSQPTLVEEILQTTKERQALGLVDWSDAVERAEGRARSLAGLAAAAIAETEPHQWVRFTSRDGVDRLRMKVGAAMTIATYFGITPTPGEPIVAKEGEDRFVLVVGSASCSTTGLKIPVRAKRFEKEDFVGRKTYERDGRTIGVSVGIQDVIDATLSLFITKSAILLSGIHSISPAKAAKIWNIEVSEVLANVDAGHGSRAPSGGAKPGASSGARVMTGPQGKMLFGKACARIKELGDTATKPGDLVKEAIVQICGDGFTEENAPIGKVTDMANYIMKWGAEFEDPGESKS